MSYEIPKNLKYEERLIFNLSIKQTLWVGLFGFLIVSLLLKVPVAFEIKIIVGILLSILGIGFAFLDLFTHLRNIFHFVTWPRQIGYFDKHMEKFLDVKKIEHDSLYLKNGSIKAVIQVQPINFHILSKRQQEAVLLSYKDFLNSLDFPIQIVMRTVNLSLDDYLQQLELRVRQQKNERLVQQFSGFRGFMEKYIEENAVKNRLFYIIIPGERNFRESEEQVLSELGIRAKLCQEKLANCNLVTKRLNSNELISLLSTYFEGFVEAENEYQSVLTLLERKESVVPKENIMETRTEESSSA